MSTPIRLSSIYGLLLLVASLFLITACSDDDPSSPGTGADINGRVQLPNGRPGTEAAVYLTRVPESPPFLQPVFWDSTLVDDGGIYEFDGLNRGTYQVYAGVWSGGKSAFDLVTPFSGALDVPGEEGTKGENIVADLQLQTVQNDGQVKGMAFYDGGDLPAPVDSATVRLWIYEGPGLQLGGTGETHDWALDAENCPEGSGAGVYGRWPERRQCGRGHRHGAAVRCGCLQRCANR